MEMITDNDLQTGLNVCRKLKNNEINPYITGGSWISYKTSDIFFTADIDIVVKNNLNEIEKVLNMMYPKFDKIEPKDTSNYFKSRDKKIEIIPSSHTSELRYDDNSFLLDRNQWIYQELVKIGNHLSKSLEDEKRELEQFRALVPIMHIMIAIHQGIEFDINKISNIVENEKMKFTLTRLAHIYREPVFFGAATLVWRYYLNESGKISHLVGRMNEELLRPLFIKLGTYGEECWK